MKKDQNKGRWFLIKHGCGAMFNVNTIKFVHPDRPPLDAIQLRCPGCFKEIGIELKKQLFRFCQAYEDLIDALQEECFEIKETEITNEGSDS